MRYTYILALFLGFFSCSNSSKEINDLNGVWIPKIIDWKDGSFETLYIYDDTSFVKLGSTNFLSKKDSIEFMIESGFNLSAGTLGISKNEFVRLSYRIWYRNIKIVGEKLPSSIMNDSIAVHHVKDSLVIKYSGKDYSRTSYITHEGYKKLKSIVKIVLPELKKESKIIE
jgi:hypothetical protein